MAEHRLEAADPVEQLLLADKSRLLEPVKDLKDKYELLPAFLKFRGLAKQHIDSFNWFTDHEIKKIVCAKANKRVRCESDPNFYLE